MSMRKSLDRRPGPLPDIRTDTQGVTFVMEVDQVPEGAKLTIRCDANGNVWAAIRRAD
jgi:hypothetical protein